MVELLDLKAKLRAINWERYLATVIYLYDDLAYSIVYGIIESYKNYSKWPKIAECSSFNKMMSKQRIEVENSFTIHQNF